MSIVCTPLGAGQDVGKSCVITDIGDKKVMFDCGVHMGFTDKRRIPDFSKIRRKGSLTDTIDCVIITHFHLDHCGTLPYFTEILGYNGPVYMTFPTKALLPLMLEDFRKVMVDRKGQLELFSAQNITDCMSKVTPVDLKQRVEVVPGLIITPYYAGHVLGAAMFHVEVQVGSQMLSVVYSGDYNMTPDRHLGAAQVGPLQPHLFISESTYAGTVRESKKAREREFLTAVHECVAGGGKVLIPVFALGRAQELCILLDEYWERMRLKVPIYFSAGLTSQANVYYKMLLSWTNQKVQESHSSRNTFDFHHVSPFDKSKMDAPEPCVLFATPGMLTGGLSLEVFRHWAPSPKNMLMLPGYCVAGTVGSKFQRERAGGKVQVDSSTVVEVNCKIQQISVSAHTDAQGILHMIRQLAPKHVMLVHGEKEGMESLSQEVEKIFRVPCFFPPNLHSISLSIPPSL